MTYQVVLNGMSVTLHGSGTQTDGMSVTLKFGTQTPLPIIC